MSKAAAFISTEQQIADAFEAVEKVIVPLTVGDGETDPVREARLGLQALYLMRQWAKHGAPKPLPVAKSSTKGRES